MKDFGVTLFAGDMADGGNRCVYADRCGMVVPEETE